MQIHHRKKHFEPLLGNAFTRITRPPSGAKGAWKNRKYYKMVLVVPASLLVYRWPSPSRVGRDAFQLSPVLYFLGTNLNIFFLSRTQEIFSTRTDHKKKVNFQNSPRQTQSLSCPSQMVFYLGRECRVGGDLLTSLL